MDDQVCPRCKTTKYRNPSLKLMVNSCGHALCESCVDLLFLKGSGSCPECNIPLKRSNFRIQLFEDSGVEKEVEIRKRVLRDYNKKEDDFATLREYNDYLEEIETIIYNLVNNQNVQEMNRKIDQYKKDNRDIILKNKIKIGKEELELEELLEEEKHVDELRKRELIKEEQELKKKKIKEKEALIDELMFSNADAKHILSTFAQNSLAAKEDENKPQLPKASQFSTGIKFSRHNTGYAPIPRMEEAPPYVYTPLKLTIEGPSLPLWSDLESGFIDNTRAETLDQRAGGFTAKYACMRALQDSLDGLFLTPNRPDNAT
ncbi:CDK-activating kinase assembly factor MAT1-like isoform X2 [Macrosteles quadrilineatus]|nr:CDK-activating kinase assembly factor MAT1-like [Macrosteles quadrilineatus]XP_054278195.1 CDK-activating kinase assembly factor MAT1-like isoform X2 [Macrosteles quadrilineatus]